MNWLLKGSIFALLVAVISGVAMAVQGGINSALSKIIGLLEATFVVHLVATVIVGIMLFLFNMGDGNLSRYNSVPWYLWLGGLIGVVITYTVVYSISRIGATTATTAIIVGQVTTAMLIDYFGLFGLDKIPALSWYRFLGVGLLALGARLMLIK